MLNYKQLYYFWHVARSGSVTQAAEQLHLTPQTISGQVAELEQSLGVALFN
ncbi:LysR family transcriptional regulator, partial [Aeromonas sp. CPF2-S1]|nr:LysR family transcriptional regulator [Aeromonas sp. CPF2-S1]MCR6551171.1 LysR family transcriptional regulator [Aeromonas sp. CPF2-S1]